MRHDPAGLVHEAYRRPVGIRTNDGMGPLSTKLPTPGYPTGTMVAGSGAIPTRIFAAVRTPEEEL